MVKNLPSNSGSIGLIPVGELRSHLPWGNDSSITEPFGSVARPLQLEKPAHYNEDPAQPRKYKKFTAIPLCVYTTSSLSVPVDGHLGCFHILETVNKVAMSIAVGFPGG